MCLVSSCLVLWIWRRFTFFSPAPPSFLGGKMGV